MQNALPEMIFDQFTSSLSQRFVKTTSIQSSSASSQLSSLSSSKLVKFVKNRLFQSE